jgi:hypothetical protein
VPTDLNERFEIDYANRLLLSQARNQRSVLRELNGPEGRGEITEEVRALVAQKRAEILQRAAAPGVGDEVRSWIDNELMRRELDSAAPTPADWGAKSRAILIQHPERVEARLKEQLDRIVEENLSEPTRRFSLARAWLRRARQLYLQRGEEYQIQVDRRRNAAARAAREVGDRLEWLADRSDTFTRQKILTVAFEFIEDRAVNEAYAQINRAAAELCRRMAEHIGSGQTQREAGGRETVVETGLLHQLAQLEETLNEDVAATLERRVASLRRPQDNPIYTNLYQEGDAEDFYRLGDERPIDAGAIVDLDREFFEKVAPERHPSLWRLRGALERTGPDRLMGELVGFARDRTRHLEHRVVRVVDRLGRRYKPSDPQFEAAAMKLVQNGNPWLDEATHYWPKDQVEGSMRTARWIAMHRDESDSNQSFREILERNKDVQSQFVDSTPDRVYVASEMAGFPLMAIPRLQDYRDLAYAPHVAKGSIHADQNIDKFTDLLPMESDDARRYKEALRTTVYGILTGVLELRAGQRLAGQPTQLYVSHVDSQRFRGGEVNLGPISVLVWQMSRESGTGLREQIEKAIAQVRQGWGDVEDARLVALLHHHGAVPALPHADLCQAMLALQDEEIRKRPELDEFGRKEYQRLSQWAQERPANSGILVMPEMRSLAAQ